MRNVGVVVAVILAVSVVLGIGLTAMVNAMSPPNVATCPRDGGQVVMEDDIKLDLYAGDDGAWHVACTIDRNH